MPWHQSRFISYYVLSNKRDLKRDRDMNKIHLPTLEQSEMEGRSQVSFIAFLVLAVMRSTSGKPAQRLDKRVLQYTTDRKVKNWKNCPVSTFQQFRPHQQIRERIYPGYRWSCEKKGKFAKSSFLLIHVCGHMSNIIGTADYCTALRKPTTIVFVSLQFWWLVTMPWVHWENEDEAKKRKRWVSNCHRQRQYSPSQNLTTSFTYLHCRT